VPNGNTGPALSPGVLFLSPIRGHKCRCQSKKLELPELNGILAQGKNIREGDLLRGNDILKALRYETRSSVEVHCSRGSIQSSSLGSAADPFRGIDGEQQRVPGHETHCVMYMDTRADGYGMTSTVLVLGCVHTCSLVLLVLLVWTKKRK